MRGRSGSSNGELWGYEGCNQTQIKQASILFQQNLKEYKREITKQIDEQSHKLR
jgi:hypothetical protein